MADLAGLRCFHHPLREAAARCLACGRHFCRECVTEHEERVLCAACLATRTDAAGERRRRRAWIPRAGLGLTGLLLAWLVFFGLGRALVAVPDAFHAADFWAREPAGDG